MPRLKWSEQSRRDLRRIYDHIWARNPRAAERLQARIETKVTLLEQWPGSGRLTQRPGRRELVVHPNYKVVYRDDAQDVMILRVKHVARKDP